MVGRAVAGLAFVVGSAGLASPLAWSADRLTGFKSEAVELPFGDRGFPDGPGAELAGNNCLACHSAGMVLSQPPLPPATWKAEVEKMRAAYKAPVAEQDVGPIVDYLVRIKGAK